MLGLPLAAGALAKNDRRNVYFVKVLQRHWKEYFFVVLSIHRIICFDRGCLMRTFYISLLGVGILSTALIDCSGKQGGMPSICQGTVNGTGNIVKVVVGCMPSGTSISPPPTASTSPVSLESSSPSPIATPTQVAAACTKDGIAQQIAVYTEKNLKTDLVLGVIVSVLPDGEILAAGRLVQFINDIGDGTEAVDLGNHLKKECFNGDTNTMKFYFKTN